MKAYLRLPVGLCPDRGRSAISRQQSVLDSWPEAVPNLIPRKQLSAISYQRSDMARRVRAMSKLIPITYHLIPLLILVFVSCGAVLAQEPVGHTAPAAKAENISGVVVSAETGEALEGATVRIKNTNNTTVTNAKGEFTFTSNSRAGEIEVSFIGYQSIEISFTDDTPFIVISLEGDEGILEEIEIHTGYQHIPKERVTGSYVHIDNELLNRSASSDILSRLEGVTNSLLFDRTTPGRAPDLMIRGVSTIQANAAPLIILDNFEYTGDIQNINPNDIESITVLKDAAASSIWGARAGNGVIVITSKKGEYNQSANVSVSTNYSIQDKPNLFSTNQVSSDEFVDLEIFLFNQGYYSNTLNSVNKTAVSPVVELLNNRRLGLISPIDSAHAIDSYRNLDVRGDLTRYFNRASLSQQYSLSLSGGGSHNQYYASGGWDKNQTTAVGNDFSRLTLNFINTFGLLNNKLELTTGINYAQTQDNQNNHYPLFAYPYAQFIDEEGNSLAISRYRQSFIDTIGQGRLLDWNYYPLDELNNTDNSIRNVDLKVNVNASYRLLDLLKLSLRYQYGSGNRHIRRHQSQDTYFTRDLINQFSEISNSGEVKRPIPLGGILDLSSNEYKAHHVRGQIDLQKQWENHSLNAIMGGEISDQNTQSNSHRTYGYNENRSSGSIADFVNPFTSIITGYRNLRIPSNQGLSYYTDRFVSLYANASYAYNQKYSLSASLRRDASNLFGVNANQKWNPLWSMGVGWDIHKESFYILGWLPQLKLRTTYGVSGNIDKSITAYLVAQTSVLNSYNQPTLFITNPPNPNLKWESASMFNLALDFELFRSRRINGSFEYYKKAGNDLMGDAEISTVQGLSKYRGNTAAIVGHGLDLIVNTNNLVGKLKWNTSAFYSYTANQITNYNVEPLNIRSHVEGFALKVGMPLHSVYAYRWGGLNSQNGNPQGWYDGQLSENYSMITTSNDMDDLVFMGSYRPTRFGSLRNTFEINQISISFNINFKLGYYFKTNAVSYSKLFQGDYTQITDYSIRWQKSGDERTTNTPSLIYPAVQQRDNFYINSEVNALKADHIRLQDIRIAYSFTKKHHKVPFRTLELYAIANNVGILWKSNKVGIDPDFMNQIPRTIFSGGIKVDL